MLHRAQRGQEPAALLVGAEAVDHPGSHVVDRDIGRRGGAPLGQFLEDQRRIKAGEPRSADILAHIDAAETKRGGLAQRLHRKKGALVPLACMRLHFSACEIGRHGLKGALLLAQR